MAEDIFFQQYIKSLSRLDLPSPPSFEERRSIYVGFWHVFSGKRAVPSFAVVDGSRFISAFRGGVKAVCSRALTQVYEGGRLVDDVKEIDVKVGRRLGRPSLYMRALELRCVKRALEKHPSISIAICDGDLYPQIHPALARFSEEEVEAYIAYLSAFLELYELAERRGILLIGVSKDSFVNYLRARIITASISKEDPGLGQRLARERSMRRIVRALASATSQTGVLKHYLSEAEAATSDEEAFDESASEPGISRPLILAPQPIYFGEEIEAGTRSWGVSRIRVRLRQSGLPFSEVTALLDRIYEMPPAILFYWRPWHGVGVYRVDVSGWGVGVKCKWEEVEGDCFLPDDEVPACMEIASTLNGLSPEPFAVKPLLDVDGLVRFDRGTFKECYEPLLIDALRRAGFKAVLTKRDIRELAVRE
ncbi:MAG: DNA double-strand break repair nuclease NurA [Thermoproteota archaeon]